MIVVSEPLVLEQTLGELTDSQTRGIVPTLVISLLVLMLFFGSARSGRCWVP